MTAASPRTWAADPPWCTVPAAAAASSTLRKSRSSTTGRRRCPRLPTSRTRAPWRATGTPAISTATTRCNARAYSVRRIQTWCSTQTASLPPPAAWARRPRAPSRVRRPHSSSPGCARKFNYPEETFLLGQRLWGIFKPPDAGEADRPTAATRPWSWRRSSYLIPI
ncbi:homeobox protein Hox-B8 isoform X3 [Macaca fascicularis]|uniref:homeobox protein Hox-B8 isoform X3 n=1 Tax=Macaca fascicularis TaxID=9541 RepID=UPI003D15BA00